MRETETAYWNHVATQVKGKGTGELTDNIWKRCEIIRRILAHRPIDASILEIGVGQGLTAAVMNLAMLGHMKYVATDVSNEFCEFVATKWKIPVVHTDILKLPDGPFDMIWAFDTLEHVRHEDRAAGYAEINRVLAPDGIILLNLPLSESGHVDEFEWGITDQSVTELAKAVGGRISKWEMYSVEEVGCVYAWVEIVR
jgi:SAM-dependent methyltransferase